MMASDFAGSSLKCKPPPQMICKNTSWSENIFDMVDWAAMKACLGHLPRVQQLSYCKLLPGILNTNEQNKNSIINLISALIAVGLLNPSCM
jgi:hypothetical protein